LDAIEVEGGWGEEPTVTVPSPWGIDKTRTRVLHEGNGPVVGQAGYIQVYYQGINGTDGNIFDGNFGSENPTFFSLAGVVAGFQKGLSGQKVGSRVLIAMPGVDGYDEKGGEADAGIEIGDSLIFVVDIIQAQLEEPFGDKVDVTDATLPKVAMVPIDAPVITFPASVVKPEELVVQPLITGTGPLVASGDGIIINYTEYVWGGSAPVRQTYGFDPLPGSMDNILPGWQEALLGQPAGSRLLVIVPPELAYPEGYPKIGVPKDSTMVYVIDILFTTPIS
jgi:peptidylprolyl isomerase